MKAVKLSLLIFCLVHAPGAQSDTAKPFWRDPVSYKKITEDRAILVSATIGERQNLKTMAVAGAGLVKAPLGFTYDTVRKFELLPKISERIHQSRFDPKTNRLFLHMSAMGYHVKMALKLTMKEEPTLKTILWESVEGGFVGMKGTILLQQFDPRRTEMSLDSYYENEKLPLPKVLMGIGLEIVTQRVAGTLREYIESSYRK